MPERINRTISILYRCGQRFLTARLRPLGVEVGQLPALMRLYHSPGATQDQISLDSGMDKGTTARSVQRLVECGFALRETDPADRRINHIYPTERARGIEGGVTAALEELHRVLYSGMTEAEVRQAASLINRMKQNLVEYLIEN